MMPTLKSPIEGTVSGPSSNLGPDLKTNIAVAALRQGDWKLLKARGKWQLYNLAQDLAEENDLSINEAETFGKMKKDWNRLRKTMPEYKGK